MIYKVLAIHDSKVDAFMIPPMFVRTAGEGEREFANLFTDDRMKDSNFRKYPEDFHLYLIGEFDEESGELTPRKHQSLIAGASFKEAVRG